MSLLIENFMLIEYDCGFVGLLFVFLVNFICKEKGGIFLFVLVCLYFVEYDWNFLFWCLFGIFDLEDFFLYLKVCKGVMNFFELFWFIYFLNLFKLCFVCFLLSVELERNEFILCFVILVFCMYVLFCCLFVLLVEIF